MLGIRRVSAAREVCSEQEGREGKGKEQGLIVGRVVSRMGGDLGWRMMSM